MKDGREISPSVVTKLNTWKSFFDLEEENIKLRLCSTTVINCQTRYSDLGSQITRLIITLENRGEFYIRRAWGVLL